MPPIIGVATLQSQSIAKIASDLLDNVPDDVDMDSDAEIKFPEAVPWMFLREIHKRMLQEYVHRLKRSTSKFGTDFYSGHGLEAIMEQLLRGEEAVVTDRVHIRRIPRLTSVLSLLVVPEKPFSMNLTPLNELRPCSYAVLKVYKDFLTHNIPKMSNLAGLNVCYLNTSSSFSQIDNDHLRLLGQHCPNLQELDVTNHKQINGEGILYLAPGENKEEHPGCTKLRRLLIFDTGAFARDVAKLVMHLPNLQFLGYKETGKVIKILSRDLSTRPLKLSHVDNRGSKARKLIVSSLRCKRKISIAISALCPETHNVKLRVSDEDMFSLSCLDKLKSVELVYHVGNIQSPGQGTRDFLEVRGHQLTALTIICNNMTTSMISTIAENCGNLEQLWFRSNHFLQSSSVESLEKNHNYFSNLQVLYLRVGTNELYMMNTLPHDLIPWISRNAPLRELILAIRSYVIDDNFVINLIQENKLTDLEKVLILVPGMNSVPEILNITERTVDFLLDYCKNIKKIGNLLTWKVRRDYAEDLNKRITDSHWDLTVVNKKMNLN